MKKAIAWILAGMMAFSPLACAGASTTESAQQTDAAGTAASSASDGETETAPAGDTAAAAARDEAVSDEDGTAAAARDVIYQVSLLQGLTLGDYDGSVSAKELKEKGDIGIGTFDKLNGELIMLDGKVYRAAGDGSVEEVSDDETMPFCDVTFFDADETESLSNIENFDLLRGKLDEKVSQLGKNRFYAIRIDGSFKEMNVRSEYAQEEPYKPLVEVLETDQTFFNYDNIDGSIVGLYCPAYMEDLNAVGWHLHFISEDRTKGGHVLGMNIDTAELSWDYTDAFSMLLPKGEKFSGFDLTVDQSEDIKKVETDAESVADADDTKVSVPFIRMDGDDPEQWKEELDNQRFLKGDLFEYHTSHKKHGLDPDFVPTKKGLETLNISGSAQFSGPQLEKLAKTLKEYAEGRTIYIVDLRQESHVLLNEGIPVSWYGDRNGANAGKTLDEINADEAERFGAMVGTTIKAYGRKGNTPVNETEINVQSFMTEKELVEKEGLEYFRLPIQDHTWPTPEEVDTFIDFVKSIDTDRAWLHFHCHAGKGRTGIMMMIYDMMMNPDVPLKDIAVRQVLLGGTFPLYTEETVSYKDTSEEEKAKLEKMFYEYVQEQHEVNYEVPWSQWLSGHS